MHEVVLAGPIDLQVLRLQRDDLIGLGDIRQLSQYVGLDAPQIHRSETHPHFGRGRPDLLQQGDHFGIGLRLDGRDQHVEFAETVLQGGTGHERHRT